MKTILEIQKLDRQIKALEREVDKCPASIDFKNYKKVLQEGKIRFEKLEAQANEIAPIKASSKDGVFFDAKNRKYSLSDSTNTKKADTDYNDAVKRGDMQTEQKIENT